MRRASLAALGLSTALVGCASKPAEPPQVIRQPVPAALTRPCIHEADPGTVGELYLAYAAARAELAVCNEQIDRIRKWSTEEQSP